MVSIHPLALMSVDRPWVVSVQDSSSRCLLSLGGFGGREGLVRVSNMESLEQLVEVGSPENMGGAR